MKSADKVLSAARRLASALGFEPDTEDPDAHPIQIKMIADEIEAQLAEANEKLATVTAERDEAIRTARYRDEFSERALQEKQLAETSEYAHLKEKLDLAAERDDLKKQLAEVETMLKIVEWAGYDATNGERACPCCDKWEYQHGSLTQLHGYACGLAALIGAPMDGALDASAPGASAEEKK